MANPPLLPVDSDALRQFFAARDVRPLVRLRTLYGIWPVIVPEVEVELRGTTRFRDPVSAATKKAIGDGVVKVLDRASLPGLFPGSGAAKLGADTYDALWAQIQEQGEAYNLRVDRGEAFTFAAALVLSVPAMSNDAAAIRTLLQAQSPTPRPILRAFDAFAFGYQAGWLTEQEVDKIRGRLRQAGEALPRAFVNASFSKGLTEFAPRLIDGGHPRVGASASRGDPYADPAVVLPLASASAAPPAVGG